jgi:HEPN domain-containing protein
MKEDDPFSWAEKAEEDWETAISILRRRKVFPSVACYHFQQCAEKYVKALLILKGADFPKTHDLNALNKICAEKGILTGMDATDLEELSEHAVDTRYPGASPTIEDAQDALKIAKAIRKFSRTFIGLK